MLTKGAIGNLIKRYRAVLKKCALLNVFGSLAVASLMVMGTASVALSAVDDEYINEIKQILSNTILTEEKEIEADNRMAIEISFSDKEPIILKCTDEGLFYTEKEYLAFQEPLSLYEKLSSYQETRSHSFEFQ